MCLHLLLYSVFQTHDTSSKFVGPQLKVITRMCVCMCVCVWVGLYIPAIVDRHRDFYMQTWTFVNRGRPRILEEVH